MYLFASSCYLCHYLMAPVYTQKLNTVETINFSKMIFKMCMYIQNFSKFILLASHNTMNASATSIAVLVGVLKLTHFKSEHFVFEKFHNLHAYYIQYTSIYM